MFFSTSEKDDWSDQDDIEVASEIGGDTLSMADSLDRNDVGLFSETEEVIELGSDTDGEKEEQISANIEEVEKDEPVSDDIEGQEKDDQETADIEELDLDTENHESASTGTEESEVPLFNSPDHTVASGPEIVDGFVEVTGTPEQLELVAKTEKLELVQKPEQLEFVERFEEEEEVEEEEEEPADISQYLDNELQAWAGLDEVVPGSDREQAEPCQGENNNSAPFADLEQLNATETHKEDTEPLQQTDNTGQVSDEGYPLRVISDETMIEESDRRSDMNNSNVSQHVPPEDVVDQPNTWEPEQISEVSSENMNSEHSFHLDRSTGEVHPFENLDIEIVLESDLKEHGESSPQDATGEEPTITAPQQISLEADDEGNAESEELMQKADGIEGDVTQWDLPLTVSTGKTDNNTEITAVDGKCS